MYLLLFILLFIVSILDVLKVSNVKKYSTICYIILSSLLIFRYGQGTDYFNYVGIYNYISSETSESILGIFARPDFGFNILILISSKLNIGPIGFQIIISCLTCFFLYLFVKKYRPISLVSLFVLYSGYFLIYQFSAIRQGLVMAILLGVLIDFLFSNKLKYYYLGVIICCTIHLSAIILLILPFVLNLTIKKQFVIVIVMISISLLILNIDLLWLFSKIPLFSRLTSYTGAEASINSLFAKLLRVILVIPILIIPNRIYEQNKMLNSVKNVILLALVVYVCFSTSELIASRLSAYIRLVEILFIILVFQDITLKQTKTYIGFFYIFLYSFMYFHNINGFIEQASYKNVTVFSYPYVSLFEDKETIDKYRNNINYSIINLE